MSKEINNTKGINFDNLIKCMSDSFKQRIANDEIVLVNYFAFSEAALILLEKKIKREYKANNISIKKSSFIDNAKSIFSKYSFYKK